MKRMALTVRTDEQMERALNALVETEGVSRQEVIRRSVLERYEHTVHTSRVAESTSRLASRWGDVLDRLGRS
ncbi:MAG: CopG domain protein DNA-binding domain protein [Acidimicrobiaceae bacterium]|nr:CopG domain protein DNA-binding domain protein [Acidimicrobiaceae bacterium]